MREGRLTVFGILLTPLFLGLASVGPVEIGGGILTGEATASFDRALVARLPFRDLAIHLTAAIDYFAFGQGRPGVVVGHSGWLFTEEEFAQPKNKGLLAERAEVVASVEKILSGRGQTLVVIVVPDKSRIYDEALGGLRPLELADRYSTFLSLLHSRGVDAPDLAKGFVEAKADVQLFFRTDTHWTSAGASVAAGLVSQRLLRRLARLEPVKFSRKAAEPQELAGDLMRFIDLGWFQAWGPAKERIASFVTVEDTAASDTDALFRETVVPVVLVGTSYSADSRWDFAGAIEKATGQRVENRAQIGVGPIKPMADYLKATAGLAIAQPSVVLWEIPERTLEGGDAYLATIRALSARN